MVSPPASGAEAIGTARSKFAPIVRDFQAKAAGCSLSVTFSSIGAGTDTNTAARVHSLLEADRSVVSVQPYLRGREGETELCVRTRGGTAAIDRVFARLKATIPKASGGRRVTVRARTGKTFGN